MTQESTTRTAQPEVLAKVVFVTGKGGVGKTTVAAALAAATAATGQPSALVEFGDGESGARALSRKLEGVEHLVIDPGEALMQAAIPVFGSKTLAKLVMGNFAMKRFFHAAPAMRELAVLEVVRQLSEARPKARIFVDLPATGHGLAWLRVPAQIRDVARIGPFHDLGAKVARELTAPGKCSVVVVTLVEPMVLSETVELCKAVQDEVGLIPARLIVNRIPVALPPQAEAEAEALIAAGGPYAEAAAQLVAVAKTRLRARTSALRALHEALQKTGLMPILLREAPADPDVNEVAAWLREGGAL